MMGMFSEIATEGTIRSIVEEIERQIHATNKTDVIEALKGIGRFALTQFEWDSPEWAQAYRELFK